MLTADKTTNKITIKTFVGDATQKFSIYTEQGKFAFVASSTQSGLCIFQDNKNNCGEAVTDGGKHPSSWFEVTRATTGKWANRAYLIKTHVGTRVLDVAGGKAEEGKPVLQYDLTGNDNQLWLIQPADQPQLQPQPQPILPGGNNAGFGYGHFQWNEIISGFNGSGLRPQPPFG